MILNKARSIFNQLGIDVRRARKMTAVQRNVESKLIALQRTPDMYVTTTDVLGPKLEIISNHVFPGLYREIFDREIYKFTSVNQQPFVLDCGANIGLATIYIKKLYPNAKVICFEPDPRIVKALRNNIASFRFENVEVVEKGIWNKTGSLSFATDQQSTAGHIVEDAESETSVEVTTLAPYLSQSIDFLKLDIEGAEVVVLEDIKDKLQNVANLFVEYHSYVGQPQALSRVIEIIEKAGFRLYLENAARVKNQPFLADRAHKGMDLLVNVYATKDESATNCGTQDSRQLNCDPPIAANATVS